MKRLIDTARAAGFGDYKQLAVVTFAGTAVLFAMIYEILKLAVLALAVAIGVLAIFYEWLQKRANRRTKEIIESWPSVLESLESAAISGMTITEAFRELGEAHSSIVANDFAKAIAALDGGESFDEMLNRLRKSLGKPTCDLTIEIIRQVHRGGGQGLVAALRAQSEAAREHDLLIGEVQAKQGWVIGTAKLAVAAPWIVAALISLRPENAAVFQTPIGITVMLGGLIASVFAFRLVTVLGKVETERRVFA